MEYVELISRAAYRSTGRRCGRTASGRVEGGTDREAVYVTALFAFFNRVADAFGIPSQTTWRAAN